MCKRVSRMREKYNQGTHGTGKTGKMAKTNPSRKTQGILKFCQNTGNLSKRRENTEFC